MPVSTWTGGLGLDGESSAGSSIAYLGIELLTTDNRTCHLLECSRRTRHRGCRFSIRYRTGVQRSTPGQDSKNVCDSAQARLLKCFNIFDAVHDPPTDLEKLRALAVSPVAFDCCFSPVPADRQLSLGDVTECIFWIAPINSSTVTFSMRLKPRWNRWCERCFCPQRMKVKVPCNCASSQTSPHHPHRLPLLLPHHSRIEAQIRQRHILRQGLIQDRRDDLRCQCREVEEPGRLLTATQNWPV